MIHESWDRFETPIMGCMEEGAALWPMLCAMPLESAPCPSLAYAEHSTTSTGSASSLFSVHPLPRHPMYPDVKALQAAALCAQVVDFLSETSSLGGSGQGGSGSSSGTGSGKGSGGEGGAGVGAASVPLVVAGDFNSLWSKRQTDRFDQVRRGAHKRTHTPLASNPGLTMGGQPDGPGRHASSQGLFVKLQGSSSASRSPSNCSS